MTSQQKKKRGLSFIFWSRGANFGIFVQDKYIPKPMLFHGAAMTFNMEPMRRYDNNNTSRTLYR